MCKLQMKLVVLMLVLVLILLFVITSGHFFFQSKIVEGHGGSGGHGGGHGGYYGGRGGYYGGRGGYYGGGGGYDYLYINDPYLVGEPIYAVYL